MDQKTANELAMKISEVNTALWTAICLTEELVQDENVRKIINDTDGNGTALKKIAKEYAKVEKHDEEFVDAGLNESYLQDFDNLTKAMGEFLETE